MIVEIKRTFSMNKNIYLAGTTAEIDKETYEEINIFANDLIDKTNKESNDNSAEPPLAGTKEWFNEKTVKELVAMAEEKKVVVNPKAKKAEIIEELLKN